MSSWIPLEPDVRDSEQAQTILRRGASALSRIDHPATDGSEEIRQLRSEYLKKALNAGEDAQVVRVILSALCDLRGQGWDIRVRKSVISIRKPTEKDDPQEEKGRVRAGLLVERDRQLREPPVRRFIADMERRHLGPSGWTSIFSLMRSGPELAKQLRSIARLDRDERGGELEEVIQPYLQIVDDSTCERTGFPLKHIWRYFRHTWVSPHKTIPGRNIWFLVRDAAVEPHPVIGIAALGSAVIQMGVRDEWIGWTRKKLIAEMREQPSREWATWLTRQLRDLIGAIYIEDFRDEELLTDELVESPDEFVIDALQNVAEEERAKHRRFGSSKDHKGSNGEAPCWETRAQTPLFRWKRAAALAELLEARRDLQASGLRRSTAKGLARALETRPGQKAIARILRRVKGASVGHDILDITVCGAVAPYNAVLGGKLVSLLLTSPEVHRAYEERYANTASIIASGMAGRPIHRTPRLVMLGTTSLYGVGSSQYNRLRVPAKRFREDDSAQVRFVELGVTEGYGSFHFSDDTMQELRLLMAQRNGGRTVRYIFGEGTSPRMREVRSALDEAGLPSDALLQHGSPRIVYGIPLATNVRDVLLGKTTTPDYILPQDDPEGASQEIIRYWIERWLSKRIAREDVLERVEQHDLSYPIRHGARVPMRAATDELPLFEDE